MKRKYKILICTIISFVLCFGLTITSYAGFYTSWDGDLDTDFDIDSNYASTYPYFSTSYLSSYALSNALPNDFTGVNQSIFQASAYQISGYFTDLANPTDYYTSSSASIDISGLPLVLCGRRGSGSNANSLVWHRIESGSFVAIVDNWLCSTEPFSVYSIYNRNGINDASPLNQFCIKTDVDTAGTNNYYWYNLSTFFINGIVNASDFALMFTDFPIYMSTTSGDSGFSVYTDFTFLADNINYNYLLLDNIVDDPQAPEPIDNNWDIAKNYLNFRVSSYFVWDSFTKKFYHNMTFNWNEYMMNNLNYYNLNCYYYITYKDSTMPAVISYQHEPIINPFTTLAYANNHNAGTLPSQYTLGLFPDSFVDSNDNTWLSTYLSTIHRVVGTNETYININDFWDGSGNPITQFAGYVFDGAKRLSYVVPVVGDSIDEFKIHCMVTVGRSADSLGISGQQDYISGVYSVTHDCLTGKTTIESTQNQENLYPPEEGQEPSVITDSDGQNGTTISGGAHANAYGGNSNVTINAAENPFKSWSPEAVESLKETWDTIKEELDAHKNNSFMALMVESYKIIPDELWQVIILCGSVISIFAVVRFIRNK